MARVDKPAARVALFPLPFQGHISPMLQLAGALHARGLAITVLHTTFNAPDPARHPDFSFVAVPDAISEVLAATKDGSTDRILALNAVVEEPAMTEGARAALAALLKPEEEGEPRLACLILDCSLTGIQKVAVDLGLPTLVLYTGSAACCRLFRSYDMLYEKGYLPAQESNLLLPVKELPPLQVRDLFDPSIFPNKEMGLKLLNLANETTASSRGAIINTFQALEPHELTAVRNNLLADKGIPTFAIGPLHKLSSIDGVGTTSLRNQDRTCIKWLDAQDLGSVLYVSFGSVVQVTEEEFTEVAWGLADSGKPFLWVVRRGLVCGVEKAELPQGFECAVEGRGKVIEWAPQQEVLAHSAIGGFLTHNGWNSTLESIYEGVPMLSRPYIGDQLTTGRYVEDAWKIGILLEGLLERGKIKKAITALMEERDGLEIRERAKSLKEKARLCLESSGSSQQDVGRLVDHILSL